MKAKMFIAAALVMVLFLMAACSGNNGSTGTNGNTSGKPSPSSSETAGTSNPDAAVPDPVTLKFMLFGDKPADMDKVLAKFEEVSKDSINTKIEFEYNTPQDHRQKMQLKMSTGEAVDVMFDAGWMNLYNHVSLGYYAELDKYFNNDEYPGLKAAFPAEFVEANKINGHLYTIPLTYYYTDLNVISIRKDIREELGLGPITTLEELEVYLQQVQEKKPDYTPLALGGRGFHKLFTPSENGRTDIRLAAVGSDSFTGGIPFSVALSEDGKKVIGAATLGDPDSEFASFPAPFNTHDSIYGHFQKRVDWSKYINKDALAPATGVVSDKGGAGEGTIGGISRDRQKLQEAYGTGLDIEPFVYESEDARNMKPGAIRTDFRANNSVVIPASSKNIDRTMKFFDWLFSSKANHDLFELGIEGEHWVADGDNGYKTTANTTKYQFQPYELTWNPSLSRLNSDQDPATMNYLQYALDNKNYFQIALSGFIFDSKPVATELAKIKPKFDEVEQILKVGYEKNWLEMAQSLNKQMRDSGLETVRAEVLKQVQAYLDAGGK
ncbi:extracellular solute-binding protein [Paenibacillus algorifonticola]|uniref:Extracellular solute-binding protein n=1 Tax=Paenibacillus algorifonticola TaxID=684063 RepID=A0A1I2FVZ0_9BACL|nr:extracellular solute-binding protein [Paenibacillus algorifonticola]SFF08917.1 extracellular solute-binding protein [Paenibacillus algorifonticola]